VKEEKTKKVGEEFWPDAGAGARAGIMTLSRSESGAEAAGRCPARCRCGSVSTPV
jgi:hypothetical protein